MKKNFIVLALFGIIIFNASYNLANFPGYFWDQGVYVQRGIDFIKNFVVYDDPTFIDHPPLGWIIPSLVFKVVGFPDSIMVSSNLDNQLTWLFLIPRLIGLVFIMVTSFLIYKIGSMIYNSQDLGTLSLASFSLIPAIWPLRNMLLDPIMVTFVLLSFFVVIRSGSCKSNAILFSGLLFGIALLVKLTAIFFLPAILFFVLRYYTYNQEGRSFLPDKTVLLQTLVNHKSLVLWLAPIVGSLAAWILFVLASQHSIHYLVSTQLWQLGRASFFPPQFVLLLLLMACPVGTIFGIFGLAQTITSKENRRWSLLGIPYLAFLFRGGYVGWVHLIPILPFLSIYGTRPLLELTELVSWKLGKNYDRQKIVLFLVILISALSVSVTIWLASFDEAGPDKSVIKFLVDDIPKNALLVTDPGYSWAVKLYRPDVTIINYYQLNNMTTPSSFYIAEKSNPSRYDPTLLRLDDIYQRSCTVKSFEAEPAFFHPYSVSKDRWWNVEVRYYNNKGCN